MRALITAIVFASSLALVGCGSEEGDDSGDDAPAPDAGVVQVDAAAQVDAGAASTDAAPGLGFMEMCDPADDACGADLVCFNFNSRGPHCTHSCTVDADCEEPSRGCNNMGVCKAP